VAASAFGLAGASADAACGSCASLRSAWLPRGDVLDWRSTLASCSAVSTLHSPVSSLRFGRWLRESKSNVSAPFNVEKVSSLSRDMQWKSNSACLSCARLDLLASFVHSAPVVTTGSVPLSRARVSVADVMRLFTLGKQLGKGMNQRVPCGPACGLATCVWLGCAIALCHSSCLLAWTCPARDVLRRTAHCRCSINPSWLLRIAVDDPLPSFVASANSQAGSARCTRPRTPPLA
jgi:hypothetical protein